MAVPSSSSVESVSDSLCNDESFEEVMIKNENGDREIIIMARPRASLLLRPVGVLVAMTEMKFQR